MGEELFYNSNRILQTDSSVSFSATLMKGFYFINGDENFYRFIGKNSGLSMTELMWDEDIASFVETLDNLVNGPQVFMARIKGGDDSYYSLVVMMSYNGKVVDDFKMIDVDILDFKSLKVRYMDYLGNTQKYMTLLSLLPHLFFDYSLRTDELIVFRFVNQRPTILFQHKLDEYMKNGLKNGLYAQKDIVEIYNFYDKLKNESERFEFMMSAKSIQKEDAQGNYIFKGKTIYEGGVRTKKVGIIEREAIDRKKDKYYFTENAYDAGTGLFNKRAINEYALDKLCEANVDGRSMYMAIIDIDDFKNYNDTYGHKFGDEVLLKIADIIKQNVNTKGACGRFGGDEYMIIFDQIEDEESLRNVIKTIRKNISYAFLDSDKKVSVSTSWGISKYPDDGRKLEDLFAKADKALYIAKEKGKDRYIIYRDKLHGNIAITSGEKVRVGFHNLVKPSEKSNIITKLLLQLNSFKPEEMPKILETIREYFDIDGIAIYKGEKLQRIYESGKYIEPIQQLDFAKKDEYMELFDSNGLFFEMVMARVKGILGEDFKKLEKQEIGRFFQAKAGEGDNMTIVSFDFFNRAPKVGESDHSFLSIIGTFMANVISTH